MKSIVCFGEVLWDMLPTGKKLGGAPLNVALRTQALGNTAKVITSIGKDLIGKELEEEMQKHNANLDHVQFSNTYSTSEVLVSLDESGSASYEIKMPCAWDDIKLMDRDIDIVKQCDAFIYGSLVARQETSRNTLFNLLKQGGFNVFDVNLRPPHYDKATLQALMEYAHFIKFNDEEIIEISANMGFNNKDIEACVRHIAFQTNTDIICVTLGADGALLFYQGEIYTNKGYKVKVADTVGSGDSFLSTLVTGLLNNNTPQLAIDKACAVGAIVASKSGATPSVSENEIKQLMEQ